MINRKKFYYFAQYLGPLLPFSVALLVFATNNGQWFWATVIIFYFGSALLDLLFGRDTVNHGDEFEQSLKNDSFYTQIQFVLMPLYFVSFAFITYVVATIELSLWSLLAAVIGVGAMFAGVFCVGHELGHRRGRYERFGARYLVSLFAYGHFHIEHNRGHHVHVSTPEDAASARMGENVYQFMLREVPATFKRAIALETKRLDRAGLPFWSLKNEILQGYAITLLLHGVLVLFLGFKIVPFLLLCIFAGYFQLTMANYLEHYGLLRAKSESGRYEKCQPHHSWNSNHLFTNVLTLQLQRHSDHHANAARPYQILRDYENVPQLPAGYPFMQFLSVFPPLWRTVMDRELLKFVNYDMTRVNVCPKKRETLFARYHSG